MALEFVETQWIVPTEAISVDTVTEWAYQTNRK